MSNAKKVKIMLGSYIIMTSLTLSLIPNSGCILCIYLQYLADISSLKAKNAKYTLVSLSPLHTITMKILIIFF